MPLTKNVRIQVRSHTWPANVSPPPALVAAQRSSPYPIDVLCCLAFTALWTRPPARYGFALSDCWAWLRYIPAVCISPELRLREEWTPLDPHHKTVLSGDFGVGFTTWFLNQTLGLVKYSDTLWVVNTLHPGRFQLGPTAKRGPQKSPDYIAEDALGNFSVLECKGTQSSYKGLLDAIERGMPQKANLQTIGATHITNSLVAGLFIPQFESEEYPAIAIADPDWREVKKELSRFSPEQLSRGISQIAYAKELALFDLSQTANALARAKGSAESISAAFLRDSKEQTQDRVLVGDEVRVRRDYLWTEPAPIAADLHVVGVRFEGVLPSSEIEKLRTVVSPAAHGDRKREESHHVQWKLSESATSAELRSPLGSMLRLTLLEA
jgi:hypothetical protein